MAPVRPRNPSRWCAMALAALVTAACSRGCDREVPNAGSEPQCQAACAALGCGQVSPEAVACERTCRLDSAESAEARCSQEHQAWLSCVMRANLDCTGCTGAACFAPERAPSCAEARDALGACLAPCRLAGMTQHATRQLEPDDPASVARVQVTRSGCGPCGPGEASGAPPGSPCEAASVCDDSCCLCPDGRTRFHARTCLGGTCRTAAEACSAARRALGRDPCGVGSPQPR